MRVGLARFSGSIRPLSLGALAVSLASACVREHTLFQDLAAVGGTGSSAGGAGAPSGDAGAAGVGGAVGAGTGGAAGSDAPPLEPWTKAECVAALSAGKNGDACEGEFSCTAAADCCETQANCKGSELFVTTTCDDCQTACTVDADCPDRSVCDAYRCLACPVETCPAGWEYVLRNGCKICVPHSECTKDQPCADGLVCIAGLSCLPGCKGDPACCFGNRCAAAGCGSPDGVDCALVGCSAGNVCKSNGDASGCKCTETALQWQCSPSPVNVCQPR